MFNDLFHPTQSGALSEWIAGRVFRLCRRSPGLLPTAGPLSIVLVIFTWAFLVTTGFALIYWAAFPADYQLKTGTAPSNADHWWWSFYYSLEMMTTLGLGDIQPNPTWLKILSACHTLIGFSFVTASITWIVLVFPALRRVRTLSRKAITLAEAEERTGVCVTAAGMHMILAGLAEEVIQSRVDLIHFPILFYFYSEDRRASMPDALFPLMRFARAGEQGGDALVRLAATGLHIALRDVAELVGNRLKCRNREPEAVFKAYQELHRPS